jgi:hypothetical protein
MVEVFGRNERGNELLCQLVDGVLVLDKKNANVQLYGLDEPKPIVIERDLKWNEAAEIFEAVIAVLASINGKGEKYTEMRRMLVEYAFYLYDQAAKETRMHN